MTDKCEGLQQKGRRERKRPFASKIHERARQSAVELHKLIITLSTGVLAVYFLALTTQIEPPLSACQRRVLLVSLLSMAGALAAGMFGWHADARRNYFWAKAMMIEDNAKRNEVYKRRNRWLFWKNWMSRAMGALFTIGIGGSCGYLMLRIFGR